MVLPFIGVIGVSSLEQIGQKLKNTRESKGLTLGQIYDKTKIPTSNLEAIELGDSEQLPEPVYVAGFIKRYADVLGLNGRGLSEEYKQYIENAHDNGKGIFANFVAPKTKSVAVQSHPVMTPSMSKVTMLEPPKPGFLKTFFWPTALIFLVLMGMVYIFLYQNRMYMEQHDPSILALKESASRFNQVQPATPPTPTTSASQQAGPTAPAAEKDCRITLSASQHVYVAVQSVATGESKFTGFLEAGDRRDFQDEQGLKVRAGNGASVTVNYLGKNETFGAAGQPANRVFMAPTGQAGAAAPGTELPTGDATASAIKPVAVKKPKPVVRKPKPQPTRQLEDAPSRYIPGESGGGTRSIGVPYRYTEGRLDSE